jgi:hypothetical protein
MGSGGMRSVLVVSFNKTRAITNHAYYIARYLPHCVGNLLYTYLVCIRPLVRTFRKELGLTDYPLQQYLWPSKKGEIFQSITNRTERRSAHSLQSESSEYLTWRIAEFGFWSSGALTRILQESSKQNGLGMVFNIQLYRQVAIALTKRFLLKSTKAFDVGSPSNDDPRTLPFEKGFSWQAGHDIREHMAAYGIDGAYPDRLQPPLLDFYLKTTLAWFEFIEVASVKDGVPYQKGSFFHVKKRKTLEELKVESCSEKGQGSDSDDFDLIVIEEGEIDEDEDDFTTSSQEHGSNEQIVELGKDSLVVESRPPIKRT